MGEIGAALCLGGQRGPDCIGDTLQQHDGNLRHLVSEVGAAMVRATASKLSGDGFNMVGPLLQSLAHCVDHLAPVINSCDPTFVAANMVQGLLNFVGSTPNSPK